MVKIITMLTMFVVGHLAQAQITETRTVAPFTKIDATDGVEIILTQSTMELLTVESTNLLNVITEVRGGTLKIYKMKSTLPIAKIYISAPTITSITATSKSKVSVTGQLRGEAIAISLSSGAHFLGSIKSGKVTLQAKSAAIFNGRIESDMLSCNFRDGAKVILSGSAKEALVRADSGTICSARNFISNNMAVNAGDFSTVVFSADNKVSISMADTSKVSYYGNPESVEIPNHATINNRPNEKLLTSN